MTTPSSRFDLVDRRITVWMANYGVLLLRIALGIVVIQRDLGAALLFFGVFRWAFEPPH